MKLLLALIFSGAAFGQTSPAPVAATAIAVATVLSPTSTVFTTLPPSIKMAFAPTVFVWVQMVNPAPGVSYTLNAVGITVKGSAYAAKAQTDPANPTAWVPMSTQLALGDSLASPIGVSFTAGSGTVNVTVVN